MLWFCSETVLRGFNLQLSGCKNVLDPLFWPHFELNTWETGKTKQLDFVYPQSGLHGSGPDVK